MATVIYVISIIEYSARHMPVVKHEVGTLEEIACRLVRFNLEVPQVGEFENIHDLTRHLSLCNKDNEYRLVCDYIRV